jgi:DNA topoisomerase I
VTAEPLPRGLVHVSDTAPGIRRRRSGNGFTYLDPSGRVLHDAATLARIRALAIPPAYERVWICPRPDGHLQATGRDARGRKQYRYHPAFRAQREASKFDRLAAFGRVLPRIREAVHAALEAGRTARTPTRELVLATIVRLLDTTFVRVGNDEYARSNRSYGLTTLRTRHAALHGSVLMLSFRGKSGRQHEVRIDDARVARVVRRCQQLPGQELFLWLDDDGASHAVGSGDVNDWLGQVAGERFTAKDFRTWHGSVQALALFGAGAVEGAEPLRLNAVIAEVASRLGNTAAVCRKAYIHPDVLAWAEQRVPLPAVRARRGLTAAEWRLLHLLEQRRARRRRVPAPFRL